MLAGFDTTATNVDELKQFLQSLADQTDALVSKTIPTSKNDLLPPPDNGILGFTAEPDDLTITLGVRCVAVRRPLRPGRAQAGRADPHAGVPQRRATPRHQPR